MLGLSLLDYRLTETRSTEYVAAVGYKLAKFKLPFKIKGKRITLTMMSIYVQTFLTAMIKQ